MEKEIEDLTSAIDRQRRAEQREADLSKPLNSPLTSRPYKETQTEKKSGRATDEYKNAMLSAMRSNFRNISRALIEEAKLWSKRRGSEYIELSVVSQNRSAIEIYKSLQFVECTKIMRAKI